MTPRPPMGVQPRQPQRTLSGGSGLSQRPPLQQRSLSQQYIPPSPMQPTSLLDMTRDPNENVPQSRYGTARRGGSRLKVELSNDDSFQHSGLADTSQTLLSASHPIMSTPSEMGDTMQHASSLAATTVASSDPSPLPMPKRRACFLPPPARRDPARPQAAPVAKRESRPKPFNLEPPVAAPKYAPLKSDQAGGKLLDPPAKMNHAPGAQQPSGYADFFPWTGDHPEDHYSESVIRQGFFDKPVLHQNEAGSAKSQIFPLLKHKSGLQLLSHVFTGVLAQRRHAGQIQNPSTFKLPPRVTLTDTKRELWLKELANPAVPLRKLSRTIPHGIKGRVLLDQCLNKGVPSDRAVWLAKCVGANDIRSFKRKGVNGTYVMGGETKWIRDWTVFVEQFLENVMGAAGEANWKARIQYSIKLAAHLYAEHLLDKEHFLDWVTSGIESSSHNKLPMWMIIMHIYWKDLLKLRKIGRRLVAALLGHICTIQNTQDRDILAQLSSKLSFFLRSLLKFSPESFVAPVTWFKHRDALRSLLSMDDEVSLGDDGAIILKSFLAVNSRNERLSASNVVRSQPATRQNLIKLLDSTILVPLRPDMPLQCWNVGHDKMVLVNTVLEWATSIHRPGICKVYVAVRLLQAWHKCGIDVTRSILDFIDNDSILVLGRKRLLYHLVSQLVRSGHFSVPHYLQWLMARGGLSCPVDAAPDGPCSKRLLVELSVKLMDYSLQNIRGDLLSRASYKVETEARDFDIATKWLKAVLSIPFDPNDPHTAVFANKPVSLHQLCRRIELSSRALKTDLGVWLRDIVCQTLPQEIGKTGLQVNITTFTVLRSLIEACSDYAMLADILKAFTHVQNVEILTSVADTVNLNLPIFAAINADKDLFYTLLERLRLVAADQRLAARPLLVALVYLSGRIPGLKEMSMHLTQDLLKWDKGSATDACSPISDSMVLQEAEGDLHDEIEKLVSNGTSLDRPTMERLFQTVINRLQTSWYKSPERQRPCATLLSRLRVFDQQNFDHIMGDWIRYLKGVTPRPPIAHLFPLLICLGCMTLSTVISTVTDSTVARRPNDQRQPGSSSWMQEVLQLVMLPQSPVPPQAQVPVLTLEECYRFRIHQKIAQSSHPKEILTLIRQALVEWGNAVTPMEGFTLPIHKPEAAEALAELIRVLVLSEPASVSRVLAAKWPSPKVSSLVEGLADKLLLPGQNPSEHNFEQVLALTNELTTPFCQLKLSLLGHAMDDSHNKDLPDRQQQQLDKFMKAVDNAVNSQNTNWVGMLPCLSTEIAVLLKRKVDKRFLDLIPSQRNSGCTDAIENIQLANNLLSVTGAIVRGGANNAKITQLTSVMVDKLADLWEILASSEVLPQFKVSVLQTWLPLLLTFISLHVSLIPSNPTSATQPSNANASSSGTQSPTIPPPIDVSRPASEVRGRLSLALAGILKELDAMNAANSPPSTPAQSLLTPPPSPPPPPPILAQRVFDLALVIVDGLTDEVRIQCIRHLRDVSADLRLRYLFSFAPSPSEGLMLAKQPSDPAGSGPGPGIRRMMTGIGAASTSDKLTAFNIRRWEILNEPTPMVGENDTSLSLTLFEAIKYP